MIEFLDQIRRNPAASPHPRQIHPRHRRLDLSQSYPLRAEQQEMADESVWENYEDFDADEFNADGYT